MANYFVNGQTGSDQNAGTSESQAWRTLEPSARLKPGDVLVAMPGTIRGTFRPPNGTAAAPITLRAKEAGSVTVDGSERVDGLSWSRQGKSWAASFPRTVYGVYAKSFEQVGKLANFNNRAYNQHDASPGNAMQGVPAEWKYNPGQLLLNALESTPSAEPVFAATTHLALDLNDRSHIVVEGITTRGHKHAVGTRNGQGIHLSGCRFGYCGAVGVWLVKLTGSRVTNCTVQGAGSWMGHYEDCVWIEDGQGLAVDGLDVSYGGHSGIIILGTDGVKLHRLHAHDMGGTLLTVKQEADGLQVTDSWLTEAPTSIQVDAHKVPHACVQLSGKGHTFRNSVFRDSGKGVLASSDGNAGSNPVCSDVLWDRCTIEGFEAGAVEGQEYAPAGRLERMTWQACVIKGEVALFYAGAGDHNSNRLVGCQIVGNTRGVILTDSGPNPRPNTGSTLTAPPQVGGGTPPDPPGPVDPPPAGTKPVLEALTPSSGQSGTVVVATGKNLTADVIVTTIAGPRRLAASGTDTRRQWSMPLDVATGPVYFRKGAETSNSLNWLVISDPPPPVELRVTITAAADPMGAQFTGTVRGDGEPLPAKSTITATVKTPGGRSATATATIPAGPAQPPTEPPTQPPSDIATEVVRLVNEKRAAADVRPLSLNAKLSAAAQKHADYMQRTGILSHTGENGSQPWDRVAAEGYARRAVGENAAQGYPTPVTVVEGWQNSPGHRANQMSATFTEAGVGYNRNGFWWVLVLAAPVGSSLTDAAQLVAEGAMVTPIPASAGPPLVGV